MSSPLHHEIRAFVLNAIDRRELAAGDAVSDLRVARALGVSRTPVRAVLQSLSDEGVLRKADRGWAVATAMVPVERGEEALAWRILRDRIEGAVGAEIFESELMARHNASRAAVKRALERLSADGLVERRRGHGWRFAEALSSHDALMESYVFRDILECGALERAEWRDDPEERAALTARHEALLAQAPGALDPAEWFETNRRFHEYVAAGLGNGFVSRAFVESFNGKLRDECLNLHWFRSLRHARDEIGAWRRHYNAERPHSALGYLSPMEFLSTAAAPSLEPLAGSAPALITQPQPENSSSTRP